MYDATIGEWLAEDPLGFGAGDANLGRYVGNDPINFLDPYGLAETVAAAEGRVIGAAIEEMLAREDGALTQQGVTNVNGSRGVVDVAVGGTRELDAEIGVNLRAKLKQAKSRRNTTTIVLAKPAGEIPCANDTRNFIELTQDQADNLVKEAKEKRLSQAQIYERAKQIGVERTVTISERAANQGAKTRARMAEAAKSSNGGRAVRGGIIGGGAGLMVLSFGVDAFAMKPYDDYMSAGESACRDLATKIGTTTENRVSYLAGAMSVNARPTGVSRSVKVGQTYVHVRYWDGDRLMERTYRDSNGAYDDLGTVVLDHRKPGANRP